MDDENDIKNEIKFFNINEEINKSSLEKIDLEEKEEGNNNDNIIKSNKEIFEESEILRNNIYLKYKEKVVNLEKEIDEYHQFASDLKQKVEKTKSKKDTTLIIDNKNSAKLLSVKKRSPDKEKSKELSLDKLININNNENENNSTLVLNINTIKTSISTSPNPPNLAKTNSKFSGRNSQFKPPSSIQKQKQIEKIEKEKTNRMEFLFSDELNIDNPKFDDFNEDDPPSYLNAVIKMNGIEGLTSSNEIIEPTPLFKLDLDDIFVLYDDFEKQSNLLRYSCIIYFLIII
jgi:hypothetical protein